MKQSRSDLTNEVRQNCFYARQALETLLREWSGTSHDVRIGIINDATTALAHIPLPDDIADDDDILPTLGTLEDHPNHPAVIVNEALKRVSDSDGTLKTAEPESHD